MPFQPHYVSNDAATRIESGTAVIVDVLRAFTTAAWAFSLGAERIILTDDLEEALALKACIPGALAMKDSKPMPGFELSNSPIELQGHNLTGLTLVQRTTHGTIGAVSSRHAERLYCASFLNAVATADAILRTGAEEAYFVVTGENGIADEDLACAEYIAAIVTEAQLHAEAESGLVGIYAGLDRGAKYQVVDPAPYTARVAASNQARIHAGRVANHTPGMHDRDVEAAMDADRFDFVMMAREEEVEGFGPALVLRAYNRTDE